MLLSNPNATPAAVTMSYLREGGGTVTRSKTVPAGTRVTINVALEDPTLAATSVATRITSDVGIIAERAMYWPFTPVSWQEAHSAFGVTETARRWALAEGRVGGAAAFQTFVLVANPGATTANLTLTFLRTTGAPITKTAAVAAGGRLTITTGPGTMVLERRTSRSASSWRPTSPSSPSGRSTRTPTTCSGPLASGDGHADSVNPCPPPTGARRKNRRRHRSPLSGLAPLKRRPCMRNRILCAAVLAAAHAATVGAQPAPAPLPAGDGWVALTIADYLKLREQANPRPAPPPPPPARATVSETAYDLVAGEGLATGTAELAIDVLDDGWVEVPLPASLFVRAARLGGRPLPISDGRQAANASPGVLPGSPGSGTRRILLSRRGRSLVTLDVAVPIAETAGNETSSCRPRPAGSCAPR